MTGVHCIGILSYGDRTAASSTSCSIYVYPIIQSLVPNAVRICNSHLYIASRGSLSSMFVVFRASKLKKIILPTRLMLVFLISLNVIPLENVIYDLFITLIG